MKATLLVSCLVVIAILAICFQGCELIGSDDEFDYVLEIPKEYTEVGKLHNEGLEYVFAAIRKKHTESMKEQPTSLKSANAINYNEIAIDATFDFCKKNKRLKENFTLIEALIIKSSAQLKSAQSNTVGLENSLNSKQTKLLNKISESIKFKYSKQNLNRIKNDLEQINQEASLKLSKNEAATIFCATSIAYSTYQYWNKNYKKWYFALHYPEILQQYNDAQLNNLSLKNEGLSLKSGDTSWWDSAWGTVEDWWETTSPMLEDWWDEDGQYIADADIEAGVAGALGGLIATGGTFSVPAAVGTAIAGSAGKAVTEIWN